MKFEQVLPALRAGKKVRRAGWADKQRFYKKAGIYLTDTNHGCLVSVEVFADDWEIVQEPKKVADYFVRWQSFYPPLESFYKRVTHEVGKQPDGAVLVPGSERTLEDGQ